MNDELVEKVAKAISDMYAPAVDAKAPYAMMMSRMAAKAAIDIIMRDLFNDANAQS